MGKILGSVIKGLWILIYRFLLGVLIVALGVPALVLGLAIAFSLAIAAYAFFVALFAVVSGIMSILVTSLIL